MRMKHERLSSGRRRAVNVSLDDDLVGEAKALGLNLSQACEAGLAATVKAERERRWKEENREAIDSWNRWLEKNGLPYGDLRLW